MSETARGEEANAQAQPTSIEGALLGLFAHISRLYNSNVNAAIAALFGWITFNVAVFGFVNNTQLSQYKPILMLTGFFIMLIGTYLYIRALQFGRYLATMYRDLDLGEYIENNLPRLPIVTFLNYRPSNLPNKWTWGERISLVMLIIIYLVPFVFLITYSPPNS